MTEKQKYLLKLFQEVDEICKEHNLRYVMAGGSLVGAVRHEGFVPWDDDVDLYMPRSDWEKFVEICRTELPPERKIQCSDVQDIYEFFSTLCISRYLRCPQEPDHRKGLCGRDHRCTYAGPDSGRR